MSQALYRKWRPHVWEKVAGQEHIIRTLQNAIRGGRVGHAYLFAGPRGTGKTSTARLLAKGVNCTDPDLSKHPCDHCEHCQAVNEGRFLDLIEIDAASNTSVEDVRDLRDKINFSPSQGQYKVYIIDEVHMLSTAAFNALLKTLEEPPPHAIFILCTTEVHKIPATVLSRCQRHEFRRIPVQDIVNYLTEIADQEGLAYERDALTFIARQSTGAMRDAISLLDQLSSSEGKITLAAAQEVLGTATSVSVLHLVDALLGRQTAAGLEAIHQALDNGTDPRQFARQVVDYLRGLLLMRMGNPDQVDATSELRAHMATQANTFDSHTLLNSVRLFNQAASESRSSWQPSLLLELAFTESLETPTPVTAPAISATNQAIPDLKPTAELRNPPVRNRTHPTKAIPPLVESAEISTPRTPPTSQEPVNVVDPIQTEAGGQPVTLSEISHNWKRIRQAVKEKNKSTEALLNSSKLVALKDGVLVLGFSGEVLRAKMEQRENLEITQQAIVQVMQVSVPVSCVTVNATAGPTSGDLDLESDGMVGTALNLGGQVVHKE